MVLGDQQIVPLLADHLPTPLLLGMHGISAIDASRDPLRRRQVRGGTDAHSPWWRPHVEPTRSPYSPRRARGDALTLEWEPHGGIRAAHGFAIHSDMGGVLGAPVGGLTAG